MKRNRFVVIAAVFVGSGIATLTTLLAQPSPATVPTSQPATTQPRWPTVPAFDAHVIADHLTAPWAIGFLPDGRALVTERSGKVRIITDGVIDPEPVLVVPDIKIWIKMGLLGLAVDPHFSENGFVYLAECYGDDKQTRESECWVRVVRYVMRNDRLVEPTKLIEHIPAYLNHSGGRLKFGPDGKLYITTGDSDRPPLAQDKNSLAGKILRINPDGTTPSDNPFAGESGSQGVVWTYGHRNSQGLAFQPGSGRLYASEHGPNGGDEINRIERGNNYGWPTVSHDQKAPGMTPSLAEFTPSVAPSGATFYDGDMFSQLKGDLLVACLRGETILRVRLDGSGERITHVERLLYHQFGRLREVTVAPDGAIWITTSEFDPPEGRSREGYDKVIRLTPGLGVADTSAVPDATSTPRPVGAVAIYWANCASCHGTGSGPSMNSSLFDKKWTYIKGSDDDLRQIIADGSTNRGMPAYKDLLTRDEINEVVGLIRQREQDSGH